MKMHFSLLLSALASTTAAPNAAEVGAQLWSTFISGDMDGWKALFADDAVVVQGEWNGIPARENQIGKDGWSLDTMLAEWNNNADFIELTRKDFVESDSRMAWDATMIYKSKSDGKRFRTNNFIPIEVNNGKVTKISYFLYNSVRIDAAAVGRRSLERMASGKWPEVQKMIDNFHDDFVLVADMNVKEYSGSYHGLKGFMDIFQKQNDLVSFPPDADFVFKMHNQSPDGLTALFDFTFPYVIKADGAKFTDTFNTVWKVDDHGKLLTYECLLYKSRPNNIAALFRNFMSIVFSDPASAKDLVTDDFRVAFTGPRARIFFGIEGLDFKSLVGVDLELMGYDTWLAYMKEQIASMSFEKMDMSTLSEDTNERVVRFDAIIKVHKTGQRFDSSFDQIWRSNKAGDKLASVESITRKWSEITSNPNAENPNTGKEGL